MNYTFIVVILIFVLNLIRGFRKGMAKEISNLIALFVSFCVLSLCIMLFSSFKAGETTNTFYSIVLLVVLGIVYGIIKILLKSAKAISKLPFLHFLDKLLGTVVGVLETIIITWIVFSLCVSRFFGPISVLIIEDIKESTFLTALYQYNFFVH